MQYAHECARTCSHRIRVVRPQQDGSMADLQDRTGWAHFHYSASAAKLLLGSWSEHPADCCSRQVPHPRDPAHKEAAL